MPGFIDLYTHYDCQVSCDRALTPSCWHGVTTVVMGNCGFSIAPCRPDDRELLMRMLLYVEGMLTEALRELAGTLGGHRPTAGVKPRARSVRESRLRFSNYQAFRRASEVGVTHPNLS